MIRPTPTHPRTRAYGIRMEGGWAMDRNGQLLVFASHPDAANRATTIKSSECWIEPLDLGKAMELHNE